MQEHIWEREYKNSKLVTKESAPQQVVKDFLKWLRRKGNVDLSKIHALDLGCGTGRNINYLAEVGATGVGMEISQTALELAQKRAHEKNLKVRFIKQSIGIPFPFESGTFDLILDVTSSNSLNEHERKIYIEESYRVLKTGGYMFVRALSKDGDQNAKNLLRTHAGTEKDTYIMPDIGLTERVFDRDDFIATYSPFFEIISLEKVTHYPRIAGRIYKRNFWIAYLRKSTIG